MPGADVRGVHGIQKQFWDPKTFVPGPTKHMGPPLNQIEFNLGTWDPTKHKATFGNGNLSLYLAVRTVNN